MNPPPPDLNLALAQSGQSHLIAHLATLSQADRSRLEEDLLGVDLSWLAAQVAAASASAEGSLHGETLSACPALEEGEHPDRDRDAFRVGADRLREGRVAAMVVAGGQGSRLGHPGPKGTYRGTPLSGKSLFQLFAEKLLALREEFGRTPPFLVMTSPENDAVTQDFFHSHGYFGLRPEEVFFFTQGTVPAVDLGGRLILREPAELFRNPDGHGGSLTALQAHGLLNKLRQRGIEDIFYFQVDNPLVRLCDPLFLGYPSLHRSQFSSKAVRKRHPGEKVGVFVQRGGRAGVIEYSDLGEELSCQRDPKGHLLFGCGNIAVHILDVNFVADLTANGRLSLPCHRARKKIPCFDPLLGASVTEGIKFESFIFDALPLAQRSLVLLVPRQEEFSPIKNPHGEDSPETSWRDQVALHAAWLEAVGVPVDRHPDGSPVGMIEIGPRFASRAAQLRDRDLPQRVGHDSILLDWN